MSESSRGDADAVLAAEELARANLYALVSRLFYGPADPNLLAELCRGGGTAGEAAGEDSGLVAAWQGLQEAARSAFPPVVRQEYDTLFIGVGKAQVSPYLSGYAEPSGPDRYLVRLREQLLAWGLARRESVFEVEDHVSGVSEVMRWLIVGRHTLAEQQGFFLEFVYPGMVPFCAAVQNAASANFYKRVTAFALAFAEIERAAFEMSDTA